MRRLTGLFLGAVGICSLVRGLVRWLCVAQLRRDAVRIRSLAAAAQLRTTRGLLGLEDPPL